MAEWLQAGPYRCRAGQLRRLHWGPGQAYDVLIAEGLHSRHGLLADSLPPRLAILDVTRGTVVLEDSTGVTAIPGSSSRRARLLDGFSRMSASEFGAFCRAHPLFRGFSGETAAVGTQAPRKAAGLMRRAVRWWLKGWWIGPRRAFFGPETQALAADARQLARELRGDFHRFRRGTGRPPADLTYGQMLAAWGIAEQDALQMVRALRIARWKIGAITALVYAALLCELVLDRRHSWSYLLLVIVCALALSVSLLALTWRLHCLRRERYQEFFSWLGLFLPIRRRSVP